MRHELLHLLRCPYTGSLLEIKEVVQSNENDITFGIMTGEGGDFPIIAGIPRLQSDELRYPIIDAIRRNSLDEAFQIALDWPRQNKMTGALTELLRIAYKAGAARVAKLFLKFKYSICRALLNDHSSFNGLAERLGGGIWTEWQQYRFSMATFIPIYPLLQILKTDEYVLDFASGVGHASFLLSRDVQEGRLVCADKSFSSLYLAQRYFIPKANFVCLDGNAPLPFVSESFSRVLCSDAMHFIESKKLLANEFVRISAPRGVVVLAHLHNGMSPVKSGSALTPAGYKGLFKGLHVQMCPEQSLIEDYLESGVIDLKRSWSEAELNSAADGLSMVVSGDESVFRRYTGLLDGAIDAMRNPIINPVYTVTLCDQELVLRKRVSNSFRQIVEARIRNYAPEEFRLDWSEWKGLTDGTLGAIGKDRLRELINRFIVIDAPPSYAVTLNQ